MSHPMRTSRQSSYPSFKIHVRAFLNPLDINWMYINGEQDEFACKRILLNVAMIAVLVFLTTPTVD